MGGASIGWWHPIIAQKHAFAIPRCGDKSRSFIIWIPPRSRLFEGVPTSAIRAIAKAMHEGLTVNC